MKPVFRDPQKQAVLEKDDIETAPLLNEEELSALLDLYTRLEDSMTGFSVFGNFHSHTNLGYEGTMELSQAIQKIIQPAMDRVFFPLRYPIGFNFVIKFPGPDSYTYPHQDWIFGDYARRSEVPSLMLWVPLHKVDVNCGSVGFVRGTSRFLDDIVGSPPPAAPLSVMGHTETFFKYMDFPTLSPGEAVVYNAAYVHGALPNNSDRPRIALSIGLLDAGEDIYHYYLKPGCRDTWLQLKVDDDFICRYRNPDLLELYNQGKVPGCCEVVKEIPMGKTKYTAEEIEQLCARYSNHRE